MSALQVMVTSSHVQVLLSSGPGVQFQLHYGDGTLSISTQVSLPLGVRLLTHPSIAAYTQPSLSGSTIIYVPGKPFHMVRRVYTPSPNCYKALVPA